MSVLALPVEQIGLCQESEKKQLTLFSPAKLNLFFRVLNKRPDGYHEIASLYQAITLGDFLTISFAEQFDSMTCSDPLIPTDHSNLIFQAANLFKKKTGISQNFSFSLDKKIPVQAGLGGGSSNAATTLWGLNQLLGMRIEDETLAKWGSELGSDVAFFLSEGRAYCEGKGEILSHEQPVSSSRFWVAKPTSGLSTPLVYQNVVLDRLKKRDPVDALCSHRSSTPIFFNDLEDAAFQLCPELEKTKEDLMGLGFDNVHMTGSGTAFFCFGVVAEPVFPQINFYQAEFLYKEKQSWYKFPS